jgi:hypothetical protein
MHAEYSLNMCCKFADSASLDMKWQAQGLEGGGLDIYI